MTIVRVGVLDCPPSYAPEPNPVEYLRGCLNNREAAQTVCGYNLHEVLGFVRRRIKSMQRRLKLITTFWKQAGLLA